MREYVIDVETNAIHNPSIMWCAVACELSTGQYHEFSTQEELRNEFVELLKGADRIIGHNFLSFDAIYIDSLLGVHIPSERITDTLILSHLLKYNLDEGHSLEAWGGRLGMPKIGLSLDFSKYSPEMLSRCHRDVEINCLVYNFLMKKLDRPEFTKAIKIEHEMASVCLDMKSNGFKFDKDKATQLRDSLSAEIAVLDKDLKTAFPPKAKLVREVTPRLTKNGTISRANIPRDWEDYTVLTADAPFSLVVWEEFNPGSPSQINERLGPYWKPTDKTKSGESFKINEVNLSTLSDAAPKACHTLVQRLLLSGRWRTLNEWLENYNPSTGRIHATTNGIGTWTHRCSHKSPNLGNVAAPKSIKYNGEMLKARAISLGKDMRSLFIVDDNSWLVGTDAVGIQLRIFGHYINDRTFINALLSGDVHALNASILEIARDPAKTFIYAFLLGAGDAKVGEILGRTASQGKAARRKFIEAYPGLSYLKKEVIPRDTKRGFFKSFDDRIVVCDSEHLMMAGYLQTGEACVMKHANVLWRKKADALGIRYKQVNFVHDEFQTEVQGTKEEAIALGELQADCIRLIGEEFGLNCPMAGDFKIGRNWYETH